LKPHCWYYCFALLLVLLLQLPLLLPHLFAVEAALRCCCCHRLVCITREGGQQTIV
jgi:hypothetical protein